jgi:hypothetical protein
MASSRNMQEKKQPQQQTASTDDVKYDVLHELRSSSLARLDCPPTTHATLFAEHADDLRISSGNQSAHVELVFAAWTAARSRSC